MPKTPVANTVNPTLLSFKPRQVLLSENMKHAVTTSSTATTEGSLGALHNCSSDKTHTLKPEEKALLLQSIAQYLASNGFSKTLKKFRSEAQIEKDDLSNSSLDLEEMYCKYLETWKNFKPHKMQDMQMDGNSKGDREAVFVAAVEIVRKKNKKRSDGSDSHTTVSQSEAADKIVDILQLDESDMVRKDKKKKKSKLDSESLVDNAEDHQLDSLPGTTEEKSRDGSSESKRVTDSETKNKSKDKKKKKKKPTSDSLVDNVEQHGLEDKQGGHTTESKEVECSRDTPTVNTIMVNANGAPVEEKRAKSRGKKKKDGLVSESLCGGDSEKLENGIWSKDESEIDVDKTLEVATNKESKGSKKRKRLASEGNDSQPDEKNAVEESKRRKTEGLKEPKIAVEHSVKEIKGQSGQVGFNEKNAEKSTKKQKNGSVEPKSNMPFQRVKVDEVVFTDERLKDNSYWAKDGAESGYGAKAQEVLGQVRGRDFRHEKTKKKRGTYRGGQIDLQAHSVKFNYSDDE